MTNTPEMWVSDQWSKKTIEGTTTGGAIIGIEAEYVATERVGMPHWSELRVQVSTRD